MFHFVKQSKILKQAVAGITSLVLVFAGSLLQTNILKVHAQVNVLLVSDTAIPFGHVFPEEVLDKTYTVKLDTSVNAARYVTTLEPVAGKKNLCPHLALSPTDLPVEPDTLASANLTRPGDEVDSWQVRLNVPDIQGHVAQDHHGQIIVSGGDFACKITIAAVSTGEIHGMKFNDKNGNGKKDPGEPGLPGWTITIKRDGQPKFSASTITDSQGNYWFMDLLPGKYKVREVQQKGWRRTSHNPKKLQVTPGKVFEQIDFGNKKKGKIDQNVGDVFDADDRE